VIKFKFLTDDLNSEPESNRFKRRSKYQELIEIKEDVLCDNAVFVLDEFANSPMALKENQQLQVREKTIICKKR